MKVFTFKLQAILNLRTMAKNEALQSYVASQQKKKALEEEVELYKERIYKWQKNIDRQRQSLSVAHDNAYYLELLEHEQLKIRRANEKIDQAKNAVGQARESFLSTRKKGNDDNSHRGRQC